MKTFQYITLRYVHDAVTGEFVNLGVVVFVPGEFLGARFSTRTSRLSALFGDVEKSHVKSLIGHMDRQFRKFAAEIPGALLPRDVTLLGLVGSILPPDDSALQWGAPFGGLTRDPAAEVDLLFNRLVARYEEIHPERHRKDPDVWRAFSGPLRERRILEKLTDKTLTAPDFEHTFEHAWKNGVWNLYEPLALDYEDVERILDKGNRWLGRGIALADSPEPHKFWFLVGEPELERCKQAAEKALNLIHKIGAGKVEFVRESEREAFADKLSEEMRKHG